MPKEPPPPFMVQNDQVPGYSVSSNTDDVSSRTETSPPDYSPSTALTSTLEVGSSSLPPFPALTSTEILISPKFPLRELVFPLESKGKQWACLKVHTRVTIAKAPLFIQGEMITGTVEVHLEKEEHIEAVVILVSIPGWPLNIDVISPLTTGGRRFL